MRPVIAGTPTTARTPTTATVTINSIRVNPDGRIALPSLRGRVRQIIGMPLPCCPHTVAGRDHLHPLLRDERRKKGGRWLNSTRNLPRSHSAMPPSSSSMSTPPGSHGPLALLWQPRSLLWIVVAGEALAIVLALAPGLSGGRLAYFGMASFAIQWVFVMSLCLLYLGRRWLGSASPPVIAQSGLAALLLSTWIVAGLARVF